MNVVIGICGGIAAYKICEIIRKFKKQNHEVFVIMTKNATEFITPLTIRTLSNNPVLIDMFNEPEKWDIEHIEISKKADVMVIAPATANIIGKIASGIADDFLTTTIMSATVPVLFVPSMNVNMYENSILQKNIKELKNHGYNFIEPEEGELACKDVGKGRLPDVDKIFRKSLSLLTQNLDFVNKKVLITAGRTKEFIDPVRNISNHSSGKMGYSLAEAASSRGAQVCLVSGPVSIPKPDNVEVINVITAEQMRTAVIEKFSEFDIIIMVAAVADYRVETVSKQKLKKTQDTLELKMVKNPDIAKEVGLLKGDKIFVGFAAESEELRNNSQNKLLNKNFDIIIGNDVTQDGAGFSSDTNIVTIFDRFGRVVDLPKMSKIDVSHEILNYILKFRNKNI